MARDYFDEMQRMRDNQLLWVLIVPFSLLTISPLLYGMFVQFVQGVPWGDEPMSDGGLIAITLFIIACVAAMLLLFYSTRMEVKVNAEGIHYLYYPFRRREVTIVKENIKSWEVRRRRMFETKGVGFHHNRFRKILSMNVRGPEYLVVELQDGYRLMLGTQNPEGIERAVKKLMNNAYIE